MLFRSNGLLRCVFEKKSIVCRVESFVFKKSLAVDYPSFGRILFFVMAYELVAHCRDSEEGEKRGMTKGMTKGQIALATKLGAQGGRADCAAFALGARTAASAGRPSDRRGLCAGQRTGQGWNPVPHRNVGGGGVRASLDRKSVV